MPLSAEAVHKIPTSPFSFAKVPTHSGTLVANHLGQRLNIGPKPKTTARHLRVRAKDLFHHPHKA